MDIGHTLNKQYFSPTMLDKIQDRLDSSLPLAAGEEFVIIPYLMEAQFHYQDLAEEGMVDNIKKTISKVIEKVKEKAVALQRRLSGHESSMINDYRKDYPGRIEQIFAVDFNKVANLKVKFYILNCGPVKLHHEAERYLKEFKLGRVAEVLANYLREIKAAVKENNSSKVRALLKKDPLQNSKSLDELGKYIHHQYSQHSLNGPSIHHLFENSDKLKTTVLLAEKQALAMTESMSKDIAELQEFWKAFYDLSDAVSDSELHRDLKVDVFGKRALWCRDAIGDIIDLYLAILTSDRDIVPALKVVYETVR